MPGLTAARQRRFGEDISGSLVVTSGTDDTTLKTVRNSVFTILIQKIHIQITTGAAVTWSFEDSNGLTITGALSAALAPVEYSIDFGDTGMPLGQGKNFVLNVSAAGAVGVVTWEGYQHLTGVGTINTVGATGTA